MLMALTGALKAGDSVTVTLRCEDGGTAQLSAIAKTYTGASEQYDPPHAGMESVPMESMPMESAGMESMGAQEHMNMSSASPMAS